MSRGKALSPTALPMTCTVAIPEFCQALSYRTARTWTAPVRRLLSSSTPRLALSISSVQSRNPVHLSRPCLPLLHVRCRPATATARLSADLKSAPTLARIARIASPRTVTIALVFYADLRQATTAVVARGAVAIWATNVNAFQSPPAVPCGGWTGRDIFCPSVGGDIAIWSQLKARFA